MGNNNNQEYLAQCFAANLPGIKKYLSEGADLNYKDGVCLVRIIAGTGNIKEKIASIEYLSKQNIQFQSDEDTLLTWSIRHRNLELVKYFLSNQCGPNDDGG